MRESVNRVSITNTMRPYQGLASQSVSTPPPNEQIKGVAWKFNIERDPIFQQVNQDTLVQSDNYFNKNEPWQAVKNGIFNPLTGTEPIAGSINYELNPLNNNKTLMVPYLQQGMSRVTDISNPYRFMFKNPDLYPVNRGLPDYMNFQGRQPYQERRRR